jgi:hypothetical protein
MQSTKFCNEPILWMISHRAYAKPAFVMIEQSQDIERLFEPGREETLDAYLRLLHAVDIAELFTTLMFATGNDSRVVWMLRNSQKRFLSSMTVFRKSLGHF